MIGVCNDCKKEASLIKGGNYCKPCKAQRQRDYRDRIRARVNNVVDELDWSFLQRRWL